MASRSVYCLPCYTTVYAVKIVALSESFSDMMPGALMLSRMAKTQDVEQSYTLARLW